VANLPTEQLLAGIVNGERILTGSNRNETLLTLSFDNSSFEFLPNNITTDAEVQNYLHSEAPYFPQQVFNLINFFYPSPNASAGLTYSTQETRVAAISGELLLNCPSYWLVQAFPDNASFHYEWDSNPPSMDAANLRSAGNSWRRFDCRVPGQFPKSCGTCAASNVICGVSSIFRSHRGSKRASS
jgi:hypothetical protein